MVVTVLCCVPFSLHSGIEVLFKPRLDLYCTRVIQLCVVYCSGLDCIRHCNTAACTVEESLVVIIFHCRLKNMKS